MQWDEAQKILRKPLFERDTVCNICGHSDLVFPVKAITVCPSCLRKGDWHQYAGYDFRGGKKTLVVRQGTFAVRTGTCSVCRQPFVTGGLHINSAMACFKCLWGKLGGQNRRLKTDSGKLA